MAYKDEAADARIQERVERNLTLAIDEIMGEERVVDPVRRFTIAAAALRVAYYAQLASMPDRVATSRVDLRHLSS